MKRIDAGVSDEQSLWNDLIYRQPSDAMEVLGFAPLKTGEPLLYAKLYECLITLAASKRFMKMAQKLKTMEDKDTYFLKAFPLSRVDVLKQKRLKMSDLEKTFFDYELGTSIIYATYCKASDFQNDSILKSTEEAIRAIATLYRDQFHYTSFKFHNAMFSAETIEMGSPQAKGLKLMDNAYANDKKNWNNFVYCYSLKDPTFVEDLFWNTVREFSPQKFKAALLDIVPEIQDKLLLEPVEIKAHSNTGHIPFWVGTPKTRVEA